jgi:thiosulfate/3-mercaptopyruvate sulfurtransferase
MITAIEARSGLDMENTPCLREGFNGKCMDCHTTCGECHISRPNSVGGGFIYAHNFKKRPHLSQQCTACHGSRMGAEYLGENQGCKGDVHYISHGLMCVDCHTADELHGGGEAQHRYEVMNIPRCENCHIQTVDPENPNEYHDTHWGVLSCQACHSQEYKNCNACHVQTGQITGSSYLRFKIGKNPLTELREYKYVTLRHIPVASDTYEGWGISSLQNFSVLPTWKYCSPHNISLRTDRTPDYEPPDETCATACHETPATIDGFFFRQVDLDSLPDEEVVANQHLIVPDGDPEDWGGE